MINCGGSVYLGTKQIKGRQSRVLHEGEWLWRVTWHEGLLWVSYYSNHEGKSAIYLAKITVP